MLAVTKYEYNQLSKMTRERKGPFGQNLHNSIFRQTSLTILNAFNFFLYFCLWRAYIAT